MKEQFLKDETFWTVLLGTLGCFALLWNLIHNPSDWPNILVNFAQIGVAVIVFILANSIFKRLKGKKDDFNSIFENYIKTWAADNKYLIDSSKMNVSRSQKTDTRILYMILDLSTFGDKPAEKYPDKDKAAFLYLASKDDEKRKQKIYFKINQQLFSKTQDYQINKQNILNKIAIQTGSIFGDSLNIKVDTLTSEEKVSVDFSKMELTKENAERLKCVVEYVKTMVLALA